jgi:serine/threonine protein phosphatase PrpC
MAPAFEPAVLTGAVHSAHAHVRAGAAPASSTDGERMHSTVVVLWIDVVRGALWAHVGDSRLYRARDGRVERLTSDDSVVQRLVDAGLMTPAQAVAHPRKNQLVAALGIADEVQPHTSAQATAVAEGDAFLLCSDGWWEALDEDCIAGTLAQARTPDDWLDAMRGRIACAAAAHQDNFSAIAVWVGDAGEVTRPRGRRPS